MLTTFEERHLSEIDRKTTVVILGDGRTNYQDDAAGVLDREIDHAETLAVGRRVARQFTELLKAVIPQLAGGEAA